MARDATNMPFERSTSYQNDEPSEQASDSKQAYDTSFITERPLSSTRAFVLAGAVFFISAFVHMYYYRRALSKEKDSKAINKQVSVLEAALNKNAE